MKFMTGFKEKAENLWYHYKFRIILGLFLLFALCVLLYSCITKPTADLQVFYVTGNSPVYQEQLDVLAAALTHYAEDADGNNRVEISLKHYYIGDGTSANELITSNRSQLMTSLQAGYCMLVIADETGMQYLNSSGILDDLTEIVPETALDGRGWKINGSGFAAEQEALEVFDHTIYFGLRVFDGTVISLNKKMQETYAVARDLLHRVASVSLPATTEEGK